MSTEIAANKTCVNCKYWENNDAVSNYYGEDYGRCENMNKDNNGGLAQADCLAEGVCGDLVTRKNFACILFVAESEKDNDYNIERIN